METLNVPLLRKVQASIADPGIPFAMGQWCNCIAGHALRIAGMDSRELYLMDGPTAARLASQALGLPMTPGGWPHPLFYHYLEHEDCNRRLAIQRIEAVIQAYLESQPKPSPELELAGA
jgi:hypothetical protein